MKKEQQNKSEQTKQTVRLKVNSSSDKDLWLCIVFNKNYESLMHDFTITF